CKSLYSGCCRSFVPGNPVALVAYPVVVRFHHARRPCAMMEIKAVIGETDMLQTMQQDALLLAGKALDLFDVNESTQIASFIKKVQKFYDNHLLLVYNSPEYRPKSVILKQEMADIRFPRDSGRWRTSTMGARNNSSGRERREERKRRLKIKINNVA
ncbi:hypothetical protein B296_00025799, partial [Ensete ventricosum]